MGQNPDFEEKSPTPPLFGHKLLEVFENFTPKFGCKIRVFSKTPIPPRGWKRKSPIRGVNFPVFADQIGIFAKKSIFWPFFGQKLKKWPFWVKKARLGCTGAICPFMGKKHPKNDVYNHFRAKKICEFLGSTLFCEPVRLFFNQSSLVYIGIYYKWPFFWYSQIGFIVEICKQNGQKRVKNRAWRLA